MTDLPSHHALGQGQINLDDAPLAESRGSAEFQSSDKVVPITGDGHYARFYRDDQALVESVAHYLAGPLGKGGAAIVIATAQHMRDLDEYWVRTGVDTSGYLARGQLILLNAADTLASFMVDGAPSPARFSATVGALVAATAHQYGRIAAFGEMVSLLWRDGNPHAAVKLEALWNELRREYGFSLLCGYSMHDCIGDACDDAFHAICDAHSHVIPEETYAPSSPQQQWAVIAQLQRKALAMEARLDRDREVQRSLAHLAAIVESSDDAIASKSLEGIIQSWNRGAQRLFGYTPEEVVGKPITIIVPPDRLEEEKRILETLKRGERIDHFETTRLAKDGRLVEISLTISPIRDAAGVVIGASKVARDITAQKRAERLLRDSERHLAREAEALAVLNSWSSRLWRCRNLDEGIHKTLDAGIELLGADKGNLQLLHADGVLRIGAQRGFELDFLEHFREVAAHHESVCGRALRTGETIIIEDVELDEAYAPLRPIARAAGYRAVISVPLITGDGVAQGIVSMHFARVHRPTEHELGRLALYIRHASDFIHRCKIEEQLRDNERALEEASRRKDEFLALLAHELRNPLAPIRYAVAAGRKAERAPEQRRWADDVIERQVAHMSRLIDDLLDVSRITRGKLELQPVSTELASILATAIETARPLIESKHHALSLDFPKETIRLRADPIRLAQVFSNLLINAAKYTDPHGRILLGAARDGDEVVVRVRDNGVGISSEMMPRLFKMFSQADDVLQRAEGGLGVGLALVRGLVALHGGTINAHSEGAGRGSEFSVRLPLGEPAEDIPRPTGSDGAVSAASLRILVVDDNRDAADACAAVLRLSGHHVQTAYDARQALELAEEFRPQAMLLDIGMPEIDGYKLARTIRKTGWGQNVMLVAVTGWGMQDDRRLAHEAGFDHHLTKPVTQEAMESVLGTLSGAV
jgi:PAS domain S-box-containing protein